MNSDTPTTILARQLHSDHHGIFHGLEGKPPAFEDLDAAIREAWLNIASAALVTMMKTTQRPERPPGLSMAGAHLTDITRRLFESLAGQPTDAAWADLEAPEREAWEGAVWVALGSVDGGRAVRTVEVLKKYIADAQVCGLELGESATLEADVLRLIGVATVGQEAQEELAALREEQPPSPSPTPTASHTAGAVVLPPRITEAVAGLLVEARTVGGIQVSVTLGNADAERGETETSRRLDDLAAKVRQTDRCGFRSNGYSCVTERRDFENPMWGGCGTSGCPHRGGQG